MIPGILVTAGEPAGIGPDLCVLLARMSFPCELTVVADADLLRDRAKSLGVGIELVIVEKSSRREIHRPGRLNVIPVNLKAPTVCGRPDKANASYVLETLSLAVRSCSDGSFDALVTAPVHKGAINDAGFSFTGHTEYIAGLTGGYPVMMLATEGLKVALATTHLPLKDVSAAITRESLSTVLKILHGDLVGRFGIRLPRILVCGLNPHAGEDGHLGQEEIEVIKPVMADLRKEGLHLTGPLPADSLFLPKNLEHADAVLAMYHDQGLPVLKYKGFGRAVNVTLGLPIIRTSVDHGTALDLAGTGQIDSGSIETAVRMAIEMTGRAVAGTEAHS